jgi:hypothetical protein
MSALASFTPSLLGYVDIHTAQRYTRVSKVNLKNVNSPLDTKPELDSSNEEDGQEKK